MTFPLDRTFSDDPRQLQVEVRKMYQDFSRQINGEAKNWTPIIKGSTADGAGTYTYQRGLYVLSGQSVDVYFDVKWTAHTGTGNLEIVLPFVGQFSEVYYTGIVENLTGDLTYSSGYTEIYLVLPPDSRDCVIGEGGSGVSSQEVSIVSSASLRGSIRYPIVVEY